MRAFLTFLVLTTLAVLGVYYSHYIISYGYFNYCNGIALGTPPCNYALELMYVSAWSVRNYWVYLGTIITSLVVFGVNRVFSQLNEIHTKYNMTPEQINQFRLSKLQ